LQQEPSASVVSLKRSSGTSSR